MFTLKLAKVNEAVSDESDAEKFKLTGKTDGVETGDLIIHVSLLNSMDLIFSKRNIIPFLVRIDLNFVKNEMLFNTILQVFKNVDNPKDKTFDNYKILMMRDRNNYLQYLDAVSKGGKILTGAIMSSTIATSTADEADLSLFIDDWTTKEKSELGNGNKMRSQKGTYEIQVNNEENGGKKIALVKVPRESEEISAKDFTYPRAAIVTARDVAKVCCKIDSDNGIKMSALALNIGWHGLFLPENIEKISKVFVDHKQPAVDAEKLFLCTIPRIRPHKYLDMDSSENYLMVIFYIINDIIISLKSGKDKFDFTADTLSKLKKLGFTPDSKMLKKGFAVIWNISRHYMSHKVQIGKDIAQFVKRILVAEREGRFSEIKDEESMLKMIDGLTVSVTDQEILNWSNKTRVEK